MAGENSDRAAGALAVTFVISTIGARLDHLPVLLGDIAAQTHGDTDVVMVLQTRDPAVERQVADCLARCLGGRPYRLVLDRGRGLSRSRNLGLAAVGGDLAVICDDDCRYPATAAAIVARAGAMHSWDLLCFNAAAGPDGPLLKNTWPAAPAAHTLRSAMKIMSIELVVRRRLIETWGALFDERFGLGTTVATGEETIMLADLLRAGGTAGHVPEVIVFHPLETSGNASQPGALARSKGVMFRRLFGFAGIAPALMFFVGRLGGRRALRFEPKHVWPLLAGLFTVPPGAPPRLALGKRKGSP